MDRIVSRIACLIPLLGTAVADVATPPPDYRAPVIAKVQIVFSMVSRHHHISDRIEFLDNHGSPRGSENYAVPMLVYEPVVTLYNPYHDPLTIDWGVRIRIWDPPVGFRFKKNHDWLRPAFADGEYLGLSHFNITHQDDGLGRKTFTLHLTDGYPARAGRKLVLQPGGYATYAMRLEPNWTWGLEVASEYSPRSVYDWDWDLNLTNVDNRTGNQGGVEAIPSDQVAFAWDTRAGFQTDHLSLAGARPPNTNYPFEVNSPYRHTGWVTTRLTDTVTVEAKPVRTASDPTAADFQVDLMNGRHGSPMGDVYQEFKFTLESLVAHRNPPGTAPAAIERVLRVGDLLQRSTEPIGWGKRPFAVLSTVAKTSAMADRSITRPGIHDAANLYDFRFDEMTTFDSLHGIGNFASRPDTPRVVGIQRHEDTLSLDVLSPGYYGIGSWSPWGGETPRANGQSLYESAETVPAPPGTLLRRMNIQRSDWPERYFIRFRYGTP